jgi:hypothetical protein
VLLPPAASRVVRTLRSPKPRCSRATPESERLPAARTLDRMALARFSELTPRTRPAPTAGSRRHSNGPATLSPIKGRHRWQSLNDLLDRRHRVIRGLSGSRFAWFIEYERPADVPTQLTVRPPLMGRRSASSSDPCPGCSGESQAAVATKSPTGRRSRSRSSWTVRTPHPMMCCCHGTSRGREWVSHTRHLTAERRVVA